MRLINISKLKQISLLLPPNYKSPVTVNLISFIINPGTCRNTATGCSFSEPTLGRDGGNDFDHFLFPFLEVGSRMSELSSNYSTRNSNFKIRFLYNQLKSVLFFGYHFYVAPSLFTQLGTLNNKIRL